MQFAFPPPAPVAVAIAARSMFFPVHRIYCVGRNYVEHAKEMGGSGREAPFFFMKPADAVLPVAAGPGDLLEGGIAGLGELRVRIVQV